MATRALPGNTLSKNVQIFILPWLLAFALKAIKPGRRSEKNPQLPTSASSMDFPKIGSAAKPKLHDVNHAAPLLLKPVGAPWKV